MVEGPGCTRNGRKVRATLLGKRVSGVAGSASSTVANAIRGRTLADAITLGKQLWLIFAGTEAVHDERAVRCHFGMNGSLHCNNKQPSAHAGPLTLLLKFADGGEVRLFQATVTLADAQAARRAVSEASDRDVCSAAFDEAPAVAALAAVPADRMACDALLDQAQPYTAHTAHNTAHTSSHFPSHPAPTPHPPRTHPHASRPCCRAWVTS
jgi:formamidopyrimidine-DNA glycosylase